ncbi:MAG TPA: hypothetical protein VG672_20215, partial [Bryobacteraceae bacterium]|nr:hypothetical protein [Bryobacteraceae bacterium]
HPLSNLIATEQVRSGDWVRADYDVDEGRITFMKEAEAVPEAAWSQLTDNSVEVPEIARAAVATAPKVPAAAPAVQARGKATK